MASITKINRGEIWDVDSSPGRGSEQTGRRPALIVQNDFGNRADNYPNTIVVAVSTAGRDIPVHVHLRPSKNNRLKSDSYAKCEQILTISKARLCGQARGRLTVEEMSQVDEALKRSLGFR
ncbi:MAG: type II toxin-antitoxin system PemK/MazF family toxin [Acidobacteriota bacterium]